MPTIVKLTGSGTWQIPEGVTTLSHVLIVAGGGGGGSRLDGGGGGAGGLIYLNSVDVSGLTEIAYSVGDGGAGAPSTEALAGQDGQDTTFGEHTAIGGGGGGASGGDSQPIEGRIGGSGGGAGRSGTYGYGGDGVIGQGHAGGSNLGANSNAAGGGGAGEPGQDRQDEAAGKGGDGLDFSGIFGTSYGDNGWFAGGGGGGASGSNVSGAGGLGGGGAGGGAESTEYEDGESGQPETGGGGGGAFGSGWPEPLQHSGGDGGSGVILILYTNPQAHVLLNGAEGELSALAFSYVYDAWAALPGAESGIASFVSAHGYVRAMLSSAEGDIATKVKSAGYVQSLLQGAEGAIRSRVFNDWAASIDPLTTQVYYAMELVKDGETVRIPISSWQATLQLDRASYLQCVIPAAGDWADTVVDYAANDGQFVIYRGARFSNGAAQETEMARAPMQDIRTDEGPTNFTITMSGYTQLDEPEQSPTRHLQNIRSRSSGNALRIRCALDWFLRPGMNVSDGVSTFKVGFMNLYVTQNDQYMDVGDARDG